MPTSKDKKKYYPVLLNLQDRLCVVVGGGEVAQRKVDGLLEVGARVRVVSPQLNARLSELKYLKQIEHEARKLQAGDFTGTALVIAATDDPQAQEEAWRQANELGVLINVVDTPEKCTFIVPAVVRRGDLLLAASTSGASPATASKVREKLEEQFGPEYEQYLKIMESLRKLLLEAEPDIERRRMIFQSLAASSLLDLIAVGKADEAEALIRELTGGCYGYHELTCREDS